MNRFILDADSCGKRLL